MCKFFSLVNKNYKVYFIITIVYLIMLCSFSNVNAQQLPLYSQYTFNGFLLNPAVAGAEGYTAINLTNREQWWY